MTKNVTLLGDSIRMGYEPTVRAELADVAEVWAPEGNCMHSVHHVFNLSMNNNIFNPEVGFMAPRSADGKWVEGFDPIWGGGQGAREWFTECNSWTYTWHVQHDVAGLIELLGGREKFLAKLDALFAEQFGFDRNKYQYLAQFPDMTCLIGQFAQGNEPSFHIP